MSTTKKISCKSSISKQSFSNSKSELEVIEKPKRYSKVRVTLNSCENVKPFFQYSDLQIKCQIGDYIAGTTNPVPITDAREIQIDYTFEFKIDVTNYKDVDNIVTYPAFLIFDQIQGTYESYVYPQLETNPMLNTVIPVKSFDSIVSLYEALSPLEHRDYREDQFETRKYLKCSVSSGQSIFKAPSKKKDSKLGVAKKKETSTITVPNSKVSSLSFGLSTIDLLPLIYNIRKINQTVLIKPTTEYTDEKMTSYKFQPSASITIFTDDNFQLPEANLMHFTVETIYNIPITVMTDDLEYKLCCFLPLLGEKRSPLIFSNPVFLEKTVHGIPKCWPGIQRIGFDTNTSLYYTPDDLSNLHAKFDPNIETYINSESLRLQFAMLKRHFFVKDNVNDFATQVKLYRKLVLEFFAYPKSYAAPKGSASTSTFKRTKGPYLHLMAYLDVSPLLYPGVSKVRVAAPLMTFSMEDAAKNGLEDSYFAPNSFSDNKSSKGIGGGETSSKDENMKYKLPFRGEDAIDPVPVLNEQGQPCFVVVEIELTTPLTPKKELEDLKDDLSKLIVASQDIPQNLPKIILTSCVTEDYYKSLLQKMISNLNEKYIAFITHKSMAFLESKEDELKQFTDYLKGTGVYHYYVNKIAKLVSMILSKKFNLDDVQNHSQYQKMIGDVFVYLISQMNETVNKLIVHGMEPTIPNKNTDKYLIYAREAVETGRQEMADRYMLEILCTKNEQANSWFVYAVYLLQNNQPERALESIKEALNKQDDHKYSLLILGALLDNKNESEAAETCFLTLMTEEFGWMEGWGVFYLFYLRHDNYEGMDKALEMAKTYSELAPLKQDEFMELDEMVWTKAILPNTIFFRTAVLLLKCRLYEWCELALSQEIQVNSYGLVHYMLSVISYYKNMYSHALDHIIEAKKIYPPNYAVAALTGHCYLALDRKPEAKEQYYYALEFLDTPETMHLVRIQLAKILDELGDDQEARKFALIACKYNATPYTWMLAGKYYLQQNDLISAEECFSEGNCLDNRYAEIWGYLALVNAKLKRASEAEICYTQAIRNKLSDKKLMDDIRQELSTITNEDFLHIF